MTSPHADPERHGVKFGDVTVTVDLELGDCVVIAPRPARFGPVPRRTRFLTVEEVEGAYQAQAAQGSNDPVASDMARALKFAAQRLRSDKGGRKRV